MTFHNGMGSRRLLALVGILFVAPLGLAGADSQPQYEFTSFDFPGALQTEATGINPAGDIVGIYQDTALAVHGFLRRNGEFTSVDYPAADGGPRVVRTQAGGINPQGDIVGAYKLAGESNIVWHSFLLTRHGEYRNIDVPGWTGTVATGILPDGTIVGCVHQTNMNTTMYGFVRDADGDVSVSSYSGTMNYGATPDRSTIVGRYIDVSTPPAQHYGLVLDESGAHHFRVPGSSFTQAWGINPRGEVVGYFTKDGLVRGFVKDGDEFTVISYPDAVQTYALGINASGDIVGGAWDGSREHGFVGKRTP